MKQPTPPTGMRILSDEELTKPLPMDAMVWLDDGLRWTQSAYAGHELPNRFRYRLYATAEPPPTDWRKMCEELVQRLQPFANFACTDLTDDEPCSCHNCRAKETLTRAKAALEESK